MVLKSTDPKVARKAKPYLDWVTSGGGAVRVVTPDVFRPLVGAAGLVFVGGEDVAPERYGETNRACERINLERDAFELKLLRSALGRDLPVLAVCRGIQILAVAMGGTLYQDLPAELAGGRSSRVLHRGPGETDSRHRIAIELGTQLSRVIGRTTILVNSHHHQGIRDLPPKATVSARSVDGVVEAIEHPEHAFVLGVQWHPERWPHPSSTAIIAGFLAACRPARRAH